MGGCDTQDRQAIRHASSGDSQSPTNCKVGSAIIKVGSAGIAPLSGRFAGESSLTINYSGNIYSLSQSDITSSISRARVGCRSSMHNTNLLETLLRERRPLRATSSVSRLSNTWPQRSVFDLPLSPNSPTHRPRFGRWRSGRATIYEKTSNMSWREHRAKR